MNENYIQVFAATGLTAKHAYQLAFNSFEASFASNADKRVWEHKLKETFERCVEHDYRALCGGHSAEGQCESAGGCAVARAAGRRRG